MASQLPVLLAVGTLLVSLCQRLSLSPILGYLATGVLVAWRSAINLGQGGEFGLMVMSSALALGLLSESVVQPGTGRVDSEHGDRADTTAL